MFGYLQAIREWLWPTKPWREPSKWNKEQNRALLKELQGLNPETKQNILILGPVGAGKSSLINSVLSIDKGRKYGMAMTGDLTDFDNCTTNLEEYSSQKLFKAYHLFDCMGIEPCDKRGCLVDDLMSLIKGHIIKGYKFNSNTPINESNPCYRSKPTFGDQMHCVIFVVSATSVRDRLSSGYLNKIKKLQRKLIYENIPSVMILTKVDLICEELAKDETKMFKCIKVQNTVKLARDCFGIEEASIHPIVNYVEDFNIRPEKNIPILLALRQAMHYSQDRVDRVKHEKHERGRKKNNNWLY